MKRFVVVLVLASVAVTGFGEGFLSAGVGATFEPVWWRLKEKPTGDTGTFSWSQLGGGAFVDLTYAQIGASYAMAVGDLKYKEKFGGMVFEDQQTFSLGLVQLTALGKYPFHLGSLVIFPAAGVEYNLCVSGKAGGVEFDAEDKKDFSNLFVLAGAGVDFAVAPKIYVRVLALFGYNLTAEPPWWISDPDYRWSGWKGKVTAGVGFRL